MIMSLYHQTQRGIGYLPSYQASGIPFLTSSLNIPDNSSDPIVVNFETVSRFIIVTNTCTDAANRPFRFGFSRNGALGVENNNFIVLNNNESFREEFRVSKIFLVSDSVFAATGSVVAGLTDIESNNLINNWSGSLGVG